MQCLCGDRKVRNLFQSGNYSIVRCNACQQVRTEFSNKTKRKNFYTNADISVYIEKEVMFRQLFRNVIAFIKQFISSGKLIDIGAGVGLLVDEANKAGFRTTGFEPSKASVAAAKKYFEVKLFHHEFHKATPSKKLRGGLWDGKNEIDVVVINHVLEHVENPKRLLANLSCKFLFIGVPNFASIMAYLKKDRWQSLIADQHRWHFTLTTLDALVTPFGYQRVGTTYENHSRFMHPWWKRPIYTILDTIALLTGKAEAMLVAYKKI